MPRCLAAAGVAVFFLCRLVPASPQDPAKIADLIQAAREPHPRLILDDAQATALKRRIQSVPLLAKAMGYVESSARAIAAADPVVRKKVGRRLLGVSRTGLKRVCFLAFAYRMTGTRAYLERAEREMLAASAFTDWNPSHFLDVAEMTAALAIGYDWLYDDLGAEARAKIRAAIVEKGLTTSQRGGWWVETTNNWNQVCHGGLTLGALAVLEDEPKLATEIISRAVAKLPRAMAEYRPDGAYPEGPGYWKYGTTYNVLVIDALESVLGSDFGLSQATGFLASSDYYVHVTGPTGLFFNYSDCGARGGVAPAMYWFAARRDAPSLLWHERPALERMLRDAKPAANGAHRLFPFLLIWARRFAEREPPAALNFEAGGRTPVAMHRSSWDRDATFVAIKGGSPGANHAHMDAGSFVMDAGGVRWAIDLGAQSYYSLESKGIKLWDKRQTSQRWTVFRLSTFAHNTLVVDGKQQRVKGSAQITRFVSQGPRPRTVVDLTSVYAGQLRSAKRGIALRRDRSALVQDEIATLDRETSVRWGMVTRAKVTEIRGHTAVLKQGDEQLTLTVLSPTGAELRTHDTAKPRAPYDAPNPGTTMIAFEVRVPPSTKQRLAVLLTPGSRPVTAPVLAPLADW